MILLVGLLTQPARTAPKIPAWDQWERVTTEPEATKHKTNAAQARLPVTVRYRWDKPQDWRGVTSLVLDLVPLPEQAVTIDVDIDFDFSSEFSSGRSELIFYPRHAHAHVHLPPEVPRDCEIPLADFETPRQLENMWQFVRQIEVSFKPVHSNESGKVLVKGIRLQRPPISVACTRPSQTFGPDQPGLYEITLTNHTTKSKTVTLAIRSPEQATTSAILPVKTLPVAPGEDTRFKVTITGPKDLTPGSWETHDLVVIPSRQSEHSATLKIFAVQPKPHPYLLLTDQGWDKVRTKVQQYPWAANVQKEIIEQATKWEPPSVSKSSRQVFGSWTSTVPLVDVAVAWKLTGCEDLRNKILAVIKAIIDPVQGYLARGNAVSSDGIGVHEGMFFCYLTTAYDLVHDEGLLSDQEQEAMRAVLNRYLDETERLLAGELTYNYSTCANAGGILAALVLQDMSRLERQLYGPGGFAFQIASGVQGDGWHQEGATNYHLLILRYYAMAATACQNWEINLYDAKFPASPDRLIHQGTAFSGYLGMSFENWGPLGASHRSLRRMLDAMIPCMDHKGIVLANNDSGRHRPYDVFEQAYSHYRDPKYAWVASKGERQSYFSKDDAAPAAWRQLLYGVESLPEVVDPRSTSALLPNAGLGVLRSQTPAREPAEQITAVLKFGTHGGWHGHFDRVSLLALERYGHPLFAPNAGFDGYMRDQYKMWDQASASHNMVIVDQKLQEAVPGKLLQFKSHPKLQVCTAETRARWYQVPDWMKYYPPKWGDHLYDTGMQLDEDAEAVLQRRLLAVTDDYVVVADYLAGQQAHTFDWLIHLSGLQQVNAHQQTVTRQESQADSERVSSYRYFTNCRWSATRTPLVAQFDDGSVQTNVHLLWPQELEVMTANIPQGRQPVKSTHDRRGILLARSQGTTARFLAILEPFQDRARIESVKPLGASGCRVTLTDGRVQTIKILGAEGDGQNLEVTLEETHNGEQLEKVTL